jgi:hypothetical protein
LLYHTNIGAGFQSSFDSRNNWLDKSVFHRPYFLRAVLKDSGGNQ